jgi:hypothetical protein
MKMTLRDYGIIVVGILLGYIYTECQRFFVPAELRWPALIVVYFLVFFYIFVLIKPKKPYELSKWMSIYLTLIALLIIIIEDIGIKHVPMSRLMVGAPKILATTLVAPYLCGAVYLFFNKKKLVFK